MKCMPRNDLFTRAMNECYERDTDTYCAICGYGIYRGDSVSWGKHNQICHAECVEKEETQP